MTQQPSPSTITAILHRHGQIDPSESSKHQAWQRFERTGPNELWQMDCKGCFPLELGSCHPLPVLDDHSRFLLGLRACPNQRQETVQAHLSDIFRHYGLPEQMLVDNGPPWGDDTEHRHTALTTWLIRLGIQVRHSRPDHPQTLGKDERLHRTLGAELLQQTSWSTFQECQEQFERWRELYNTYRPHEALALEVPAERYHPSPRPFPEHLPPILYEPTDSVRKVDQNGCIYFVNRRFRVGKAFRRQPVALRPAATPGEFEVFFCHQRVATISLKEHNPKPSPVTHVSEHL